MPVWGIVLWDTSIRRRTRLQLRHQGDGSGDVGEAESSLQGR
ncbi:hypothetical protein LINGRAHAP2_LOCUS9798 [Linum grandiflorum]